MPAAVALSKELHYRTAQLNGNPPANEGASYVRGTYLFHRSFDAGLISHVHPYRTHAGYTHGLQLIHQSIQAVCSSSSHGYLLQREITRDVTARYSEQ